MDDVIFGRMTLDAFALILHIYLNYRGMDKTK